MKKPTCLVTCAFVLILVTVPLSAQEPDEDARIEEIIESLTVEERVGQLFMIDFVGAYTSDSDAFVELIRDYKVGGLVLTWPNNNILNDAENTPLQVATLTNRLQQLAYESTRHGGADGEWFLPLFIAVDHEGDGFPRTHLRNGFTPIPSAMAIGATWNPADAQAVGEIIGRELHAVGVNMLFGPDLDVLLRPRPEGAGDMNIRVFGGDPDWVGTLGRAYIRGVHQGSEGHVLTVAKHFPGHGASDRSPDDHVPTVNKSLDLLMTSDLVPFFDVTRIDPNDPAGTTDAMMPSHIRYRGFQGDPSQFTRPISLDRSGMAQFLELSPLHEWRLKGGLVVCDSLGVGGIKEFYDPTLQKFPHRQVAQDALMAGNDVLPVVSFALGGTWFSDRLPNIKDTVTYFREQYETKLEFRERVDDALRHILRAKLRSCPDLSLESTQVDTDRLSELVGRGDVVIDQVARNALTLLYPSLESLNTLLPAPPRIDDEILIMGCFEDCLSQRLSADTITGTLRSLYGPAGTGQIAPELVHTIDFAVLADLLDDELPGEDAEAIREKISSADWIILALTEYRDRTVPATTAGRRFLRDMSFDLDSKRVIAIAYHAPYYLDATEISRLTAYYAIYSKIPPFVKVSLQALFEEVAPAGGASPVSVEGIGYDLQNVLQPAADQVIELRVTHPDTELVVGQSIQVRTLPILDRNGHTVRDGTQVRFSGRALETGRILTPETVTATVNGVGAAQFYLSEAGSIEVRASCDSASSSPLLLDVVPLPGEEQATLAPTLAAAPTATAPPVATAAPPAGRGPDGPSAPPWLEVVAQLLAIAATVLGIVFFFLDRRKKRARS